MATLIYHIAITLDHYIANSEGDCPVDLFAFEGQHAVEFLEEIKNYDMVLMGKNTYEFGYKFGQKPGERGYKDLKHVIYSKSIDFDSNDEVEVVKTDAVEHVRSLKQQPEKKIWLCGGSALAASLFDAKLIDKLVIKINPAIAGSGLPLFGRSRQTAKLKLVNSKAYDNGVILAEYEVGY